MLLMIEIRLAVLMCVAAFEQRCFKRWRMTSHLSAHSLDVAWFVNSLSFTTFGVVYVDLENNV